MGADETNLELRSLLRRSGQLELSLDRVPMPEPAADEVVVALQAAPINPSDMIGMLVFADPASARTSGSGTRPVTLLDVPEAAMGAAWARLDQPLPMGGEGAGLVTAAGGGAAAQALLGRRVGIVGAASYARYRAVKAADCLPLPEGATAADGAGWFVNPMTVLGMVDTMRAEGHTALVHTVGASNLGQMLNRVCRTDGIGLVNIVRSDAQGALLRAAGAAHVCNSTASGFAQDLLAALEATGATLAFDAIGGGRLAGQILAAMEQAASRRMTDHSRYGSGVHKQVYIYGGLDLGPTLIDRSFGLAWGIGGWLVTPFLEKAGAERVGQLRARVTAELTTTFASRYTATLSLADAINPDVIRTYTQRATDRKYLIDPSK